jgi:hypothetical protein
MVVVHESKVPINVVAGAKKLVRLPSAICYSNYLELCLPARFSYTISLCPVPISQAERPDSGLSARYYLQGKRAGPHLVPSAIICKYQELLTGLLELGSGGRATGCAKSPGFFGGGTTLLASITRVDQFSHFNLH